MDSSPRRLLIATRNPGKAGELASLLAGCPFPLVTLEDAGIDQEVSETGCSLEENAELKATTYSGHSGLITLADDSGLEVEALHGEPGPRSSRYAGPDATDADRIAHLLRKLENIADEHRQARFRCVIALARPGMEVQLHWGECRGRILREPRGRRGFGYDPIFYLPELGRTMAELTSDEKNRISHRAEAARRALAALERLANELSRGG